MGLLQPRRFSLLDHCLYAFCWLGFLAVVLIAASLTPSPTGIGTHTQLHLPPCGFYETFHKPCPSCGMTTAFASIMHGKFIQAFNDQPAGVAVFLAALAAWFYLPYAWIKRRPFDTIFELKAFLPVVLTLILLILGVWIWRLLL